ncbi:cyclopropane-fatty-acyl-phospholipid synthase-like protein [Lacipirellula parvula]|uniref:Cyclopropane-fatty-acyl-phospholipid synthase-like protein n=2 Tax=Lacipirellula parvula TaxID=2650471 RepID=A0A5K7XGT9_9BACT|nr:cyclopropane-fatty-acyl-phospholipid synthase-like protein [Lacipirellula parvula]
MLPDSVIRAGIRKVLERRLARERAAIPADHSGRLQLLRERFASGPIAEGVEVALAQQYEAPASLFLTMLGPWLKYSAGLWENPDSTLLESEEAMLALTCKRAEIADGQRILDLGCGWGALTFWMAERYPNADVVAISNSRTQHKFITEQALARGLMNVRHVRMNIADFDREPPAEQTEPDAEWQFDRIVSIEMFEHMRNVESLLTRLAGWLRPDGKLFLHAFCHRELFYRFNLDGQYDWMARHFFTGGAMPSADLFEHIHGPLQLQQKWEVAGQHYARTWRAWLGNLDANREEIIREFEQTQPPVDARRQFQRWRMFLMAGGEIFTYGDGSEWFVMHALLSK